MSSDGALVEAMKQQYSEALEIFEETIVSFPEADWKSVQGEFRPDAMSLHALQAIDFHLFCSDDSLETWTFSYQIWLEKSYSD